MNCGLATEHGLVSDVVGWHGGMYLSIYGKNVINLFASSIHVSFFFFLFGEEQRPYPEHLHVPHVNEVLA